MTATAALLNAAPRAADALDVRPIAFVNTKDAPVSKVTSIAWPALVAMLADVKIGPKNGAGWMPAEIDTGPRTAARVRSISYVVLDIEAEAVAVNGDDGEPITDTHGERVKRAIGPEPPGVDDMLAELELFGWRAFVHTSYSHGPEHARYRVVFDLSRPLLPAELRPLVMHIAALIGVSDCVDKVCAEPARLFYLPRCPAERVELFRHGRVEGDPLDVDELLNDAAKIERAHQAARSRRHGERSGGVIDAFNAAHDIGTILARHGYIARGRRRWLHPSSTTGEPGVRLLPDSTPERVFSSHGSDPLNDGHAHDCFDVYRILDHGGDLRAAVKEAARLLGMDHGTATSDAPHDNVGGAPDEAASEGTPYYATATITRADTVQPIPIRWLWHGWLARGKLHILGGAAGTGKTTIAIALAATVTIAGRWPDGAQAPRGNVAIWSGEDDFADTLVPRLIAAGADRSRVHLVSAVMEGNERRAFDPATDMPALERALANIGDVRLLVVDPVVSAVAGDSHKNAEVRRGLQPLADLASKLDCALLGITHFSKGTAGREPLERVTGSIAFGAVARVVMVAAKKKADDDADPVRLFARAKSNIGRDDGGFTYDLQQCELDRHPGLFASRVEWGEAVEGTARALLAEAEADERDEDGGTRGDARDFLRDLLADGPLPTKAIKGDADGAGFSWRTIRRAQSDLGIVAKKEGGRFGSTAKQQWVWCLPDGSESLKVATNAEGVHQKRVDTFRESGHLQASEADDEAEL